MAKKDMDIFADALRNDPKLADAFAKAVSETALDNGYDVQPEDVLEQFADGMPVTREMPEDDDAGGGATTMAIGEEGGRRFTLAIGEDDRGVPHPPSRVTSMALGEEGPKPPRRR